MVFWINPAEIIDSTKLMEFVCLNPYTFVGDHNYALIHVSLTVYNGC
jgi:hypothetical protein